MNQLVWCLSGSFRRSLRGSSTPNAQNTPYPPRVLRRTTQTHPNHPLPRSTAGAGSSRGKHDDKRANVAAGGCDWRRNIDDGNDSDDGDGFDHLACLTLALLSSCNTPCTPPSDRARDTPRKRCATPPRTWREHVAAEPGAQKAWLERGGRALPSPGRHKPLWSFQLIALRGRHGPGRTDFGLGGTPCLPAKALQGARHEASTTSTKARAWSGRGANLTVSASVPGP
ncbi:hypothetical protein B0T25DRAFT_34152 [Lasiosphaeria hispida]|uniref:Uncharacterized protein n=1 Tax=Lasiosphaeria hispida TaxID=260671 RepID=A0AAJ0MJY8_9PEZI|nr:hypothetical protein B0T25DRAFT_34152 [Lasiosphaeria hispida]